MVGAHKGSMRALQCALSRLVVGGATPIDNASSAYRLLLRLVECVHHHLALVLHRFDLLLASLLGPLHLVERLCQLAPTDVAVEGSEVPR